MRRKRAPIYSALAGAVAAALILIPSAGSDNGDPLILGSNTNSAASTTMLTSTGGIGLSLDATSAGAVGLYGHASASTGAGTGVIGVTASSGAGTAGVYGFLGASSPGVQEPLFQPSGVRGASNSGNSFGPGVFGVHLSTAGSAPGVLGETASTDAGGIGVTGQVTNVAPGAGSTGVRGLNKGTNGNGYGVWGSHAGGGTGVLGQSSSGIGVLGFSALAGLYGFGTYGVIGASSGGGGLAGLFAGNVNITGTVTKGAGAFRIDHPLDPAHKYLQHSFVESPDMMDVYNGNVTTDQKGFAVVKLPSYFQALNRSFRYQLTTIGHPGQFVQTMIVKEIAHNRFTLETSKPNVKVSWQVTGIRHDAYANAHRIPVVLEKSAKEQGKYLHPELYGKPGSLSAGDRNPSDRAGEALEIHGRGGEWTARRPLLLV